MIRARREVIVSGGTYNSPHLLMLSGIGPAAHLKDHGIAVLHDSPGVGRNLQEHPDRQPRMECQGAGHFPQPAALGQDRAQLAALGADRHRADGDAGQLAATW